MLISIDVGYSAVKAMADNGIKIMFPSFVAPAKQSPINWMADVNGFANKKYTVTINNNEDYLVGEAAAESLCGMSTMSRVKDHEIHDLLLQVASYLCIPGSLEPKIHLAVGLPMGYFESQTKVLKERLEKLFATISVEKGIPKKIKFEKVTVIPQGMGVMFSESKILPVKGRVGIIDIGSYTVDYMLLEMKEGKPIIVHDGCGSLEAGTYLVQKDLADAFKALTGAPLANDMYTEALSAAMNNELITFGGKEYDLSGIYLKSCNDISRLIQGRIHAAWLTKSEYLKQTIYAGGGAEMFKNHLQNSFPGTIFCYDPVFANCRGFLKCISSIQTREVTRNA